jgi:CBS domain-containing protein
MKVKDIMTSPAMFVLKDTSVSQVAIIMKDNDVGVVPVCDENGSVLGVVTDRDIVIRALSQNKNLDEIKVSDIMTSEVTTVSPMTDVDDVYEIMSDIQIRRLPVVDKTTLVGMVTLGDLSQAIDYSFETADVLCDVCRGCSNR